jgi:hypothetical protein
MTPIVLRAKERGGVEAIVHRPGDANSLRRAQALLWLDEGESVQEVAGRLHFSRQAIYNWLGRFQRRAALPLAARVADGGHPGRPRTVTGVSDPVWERIRWKRPRHHLARRSPTWRQAKGGCGRA